MKLREVLVIDDSDPDLLYTEVMLEAAGVAERIRPVGTGQEALAYLSRPQGHEVDVILLDINMPEMNGYAFLEAYEALHDSQQAHAVVVMLTSSPDALDREQAFRFPSVRSFIIKPIRRHHALSLLDLVAPAGTAGRPA